VLHVAVGSRVPLLITVTLTRFSSHNRSWAGAVPIAPFALLAGLAFNVPYAMTAVMRGAELPSLLRYSSGSPGDAQRCCGR
jgi:lactate permease